MRDDHPAKKLLTGLCDSEVATPHGSDFAEPQSHNAASMLFMQRGAINVLTRNLTCSAYVLYGLVALPMQHDDEMRAAACAVYLAVHPTRDWAPLPFEEAERFGTAHYRQAVEAVQQVQSFLTVAHGEQSALL